MRSVLKYSGFTVLLLAGMTRVSAHHSAAQFDLSRTVSFNAVVKKLEWTNPHVFVQVERVDDDDGEVTAWQIEADGVSMLLPHGWTRESLSPGDPVHVVAYPPRAPARHSMLGYSITKQDGTILAPNPDRYSADVPVSSGRASGIEGVWLPTWDAFFGLLNRPWPLTERGEPFRNAPESTRNPIYNCVPFAAPRIMVIPVRTEIEVLTDRVLIRVDWLNVERVVYTDGRGHPDGGERTIQGHTTGRWEGITLVMDTALFSNDSIGDYSLPTGPGKRIEERLSLGADGITLSYEYRLEDPEYLTEPVTGGGIWDYRPELQPSSLECDLNSARRDLQPIE